MDCYSSTNSYITFACRSHSYLIEYGVIIFMYTSAIITYSNRSTTLSPRLDLSGFWPGTETKREVWLLLTGFGIAPVNNLVSLTWLLWALRSFRSFTWHYIRGLLHFKGFQSCDILPSHSPYFCTVQGHTSNQCFHYSFLDTASSFFSLLWVPLIEYVNAGMKQQITIIYVM